MDTLLKKLLYAGVGSVAYGYELGRDLIDEMVKKGELTLQQGQNLNDELQQTLSKINLDLSGEMNRRIDALEARIAKLEQADKE
ncbi:MAG: phasin family protein [Erysipelotrichaceae bacterium]